MAMMKYFLLGGNEFKYVEKQRKLLHFFHFAEINSLFSFSIYIFLLFGSNMIMIMIVIMSLTIYLFT